MRSASIASGVSANDLRMKSYEDICKPLERIRHEESHGDEKNTRKDSAAKVN